MTAWWPTLIPFLATCVPLTFATVALAPGPREPLRRVSMAAWAAAALTLVVVLAAALAPSTALAAGLGRLVRIDAVTDTMLVLVCALAVVIVRYSRSQLRGDPGELRYARALAATLAAVTVLVVANHLVVIAIAWMGTSLALHQLLTFFRERPRALVAAHKKFLLSRFADGCVLVALAMIALSGGSLGLDDLHAWAVDHAAHSAPVQVAAVLLVVAVALRSAQLPFHGWLTQVMEAPTPVSALLHAGIVNIGGFLMIRLSPFMAHAPAAQGLLVIVGTTTAVVAALVMTTRVSVKASLAWSTCAQMGFMLVQCGLGLWHLALFHLVAHSLYKAHAFLAAGSAVEVWRMHAMAPRRGPVSATRMVAAAVTGTLGVAALGMAIGRSGSPSHDPTVWPLALFLGPSLAPLLAHVVGSGWRPLSTACLGGLGVTLLYLGWHSASLGLLAPPAAPPASTVAWLVAATGFVLLFGLQVVLQSRPDGRLARALARRLFAGLYLDEIFTRLTFRLWPPELPGRRNPLQPLHAVESMER